MTRSHRASGGHKTSGGGVHKSFGHSRPGSGGRFKACVASMSHRKGVDDPAAVCAAIGRKKYGKARFQHMASAGH